mmetsp:Transcript_76947/g.178473  ORF Transcript_76947/g.178473 Transcript_76947/m.178473 type:complete len:88 (-) Transcript_76947:502-765(-)
MVGTGMTCKGVTIICVPICVLATATVATGGGGGAVTTPATPSLGAAFPNPPGGDLAHTPSGLDGARWSGLAGAGPNRPVAGPRDGTM